MLRSDQLVYIGLEVFIACLSVVGNVLVCWAVCLNSNLQTVTNLFVVSLAVADVAVGLLAIPFAITISAGVCVHFYACLFIACFVLVLTQSSIFSLLAIAVDRYIAIKNPLRYSSVVTARRAKTIVALCWIFSLAIGLTPILGWNTGGNTTSSTACPLGKMECTFEGVVTLHYMVYFNFFGCVLMPLVAMLVIYAHIFMAARRQLRLICVEVAPASSKSSLQKEVHAAKSLAIIVGLFAFCWLPLHIINCFNHLCHSCQRPHIWVMNIAIILSHANSVVNPFIYAYRIREFKHTFRRILHQCILGNRKTKKKEIRNGNKVNGCRSRSSSHSSKEVSSCSTVVNTYIVEPNSESLPPEAGQESSRNWTTLGASSNFIVPCGCKVNTHVSQVQHQCFLGQRAPYEEKHEDLLNAMDNGHNFTFINVRAVTQTQTGSKQSAELPEVS